MPLLRNGPTRSHRSTGWRAVATRASAIVALVAACVALWEPARRYVGLAQPAQFYRPVAADRVASSDLIAVAHNAGDHPTTTSRAVRHGAAAVEIDVILARGTLVAGRVMRPLPWLAETLFQGPTLREMWDAIPPRTDVLLDLKETDRALLDQLVRYLATRADARDVMVSCRDAAALRYLHERLPGVALLLTAAWPADVVHLQRAGAIADVVDGVSAYEGLLDAELVGWLHERDLKILAWPVNDQARLAALAAAGVDGVTTDNLAIIDALARAQ